MLSKLLFRIFYSKNTFKNQLAFYQPDYVLIHMDQDHAQKTKIILKKYSSRTI